MDRTCLGYSRPIVIVGVLALLLALATVFPPEPSTKDESEATSEFEPTAVGPLQSRVDEATAWILGRFNSQDREGYLAAFAEDVMMLPDGSGLVAGRDEVRQQYDGIPKGLRYEPMEWNERMFAQLGDWIVEEGLVSFRFRLSEDAPVQSDPRQALTIWQARSDGSLAVRLLAWNRWNEMADEPMSETRSWAIRSTRTRETPADSDVDLKAIRIAEDGFHQTLLERRFADAARYYSEGATLMVPDHLPIRGRAAILDYLGALSDESVARDVDREIADIETHGDFAFVVNRFRWTFATSGEEVEYQIRGKGVHIWERTLDGDWRILFDLPNASQRTR